MKKKNKKQSKKQIEKSLAAFAAQKDEKKAKVDKKRQKRDKKRQRKAEKKQEKIMKLVKSEFQYRGDEVVNTLAKSVAITKKLQRRDEDALAAWRGEYYDILFRKIKKLITEHNERMGFDAEKLGEEIAIKREKLRALKNEAKIFTEEIKSLKTEKGILEDA